MPNSTFQPPNPSSWQQWLAELEEQAKLAAEREDYRHLAYSDTTFDF